MCAFIVRIALPIAVSACLLTQPLAAQSPDTSRFKKHHEKISIERCLGILEAHPDLYAYLCQDEAKRRVFRVSATPLARPGGKHLEAAPAIPDMELDLYGLAISKEAVDFLATHIAEHNKKVADVQKLPKTVDERAPVFKPIPELLELVDQAKAQRQAVAAAMTPPARTPTGSRQEYLRMAGLLSFDHRLSGNLITPTATPAALDPLKRSPSPQIQHAAVLLSLGLEEIEKNRGSGARAAENAARAAEETRNAAERGEYKEKGVYYDYDDRGNLRKNEYEIDRSLWPVLSSALVAGMAGQVAPEAERRRERLYLDGARIRAWDELLPEMAEQHSGPPTQRQLVQIDYLTDDPGRKPLPTTSAPDNLFGISAADTFRGRYVATNLAPRDLHNVTLAVDMFHFSTLPAVTLRHVYFMPVWKSGEKLELSRSFFGDMKRGGQLYSVVAGEEVHGGLPGVNPELEGLAGMVQMQSTLWSDEARQPAKDHDFPQRAQAISQVFIRYAERLLTGPWALSRPKRVAAKPGVAAAPTPLTDRIAEERTQHDVAHFLKHVFEIMPADSAEVHYAMRMLTDFRPVREEVLKKRDAALIAVCGEGKRYAGTWATPGHFGNLGMLFLACDRAGERIRAELFDLDKPELRRLVAGYIAKDWRTQERMIMLEPVVKDQGTQLGHVMDTLVQSYCFKLKDAQLLGEASSVALENGGGYDGTQRVLKLKETPGDAAELTEAKKRDQAAPQTQPQRPSDSRPDNAPPDVAEILERRKRMSLGFKPGVAPGDASRTTAGKEPAAGNAGASRTPDTARSRGPLGGNSPPNWPGSPLAGGAPATEKGSRPNAFSPFGGLVPPPLMPGEGDKAKKLTPAEARAKAMADAQKEKLALQALNLAKQAIARKDTNTARAQLRYVLNFAPESPAAKQAGKLLKELDEK